MFDKIGDTFPGSTVINSDGQASIAIVIAIAIAIAIAKTPFCILRCKIKHHYIKKDG